MWFDKLTILNEVEGKLSAVRTNSRIEHHVGKVNALKGLYFFAYYCMLDLMSYPFEPYKVKILDSIKILSRSERTRALLQADYNLFKVPADKVTIDLLTDSGTSALSQEQFSQMMLGDESYASAKSWERLESSIKSFTGKKEIIPVHQGRAAEKIIAEVLLQKGDFAFSNGFFDTTRANF